ncbi:Crp/Fnr family transcriptional regulator [Paraglaciecola sp. L3A3]|uniref:Crp/Fnr family transcriptional regulator n=1 Tax=Paraglaciecola sp. L3A3 TaxID=2686358 RepID=UPI00131C0934|nr:Crp/Fnr family transcriptional regulator [Paraglaciecola sp. L3A3]
MTPQNNKLLNALSTDAQQRIFSHLKLVDLPRGKVIFEANEKLQYVYFPINSIVSLLYVMEDGSSADVSIIGNEGMVGIAVFMGGESTPRRAVVQSAGQAYRLSATELQNEFLNHPDIRLLLLRYTQSLFAQVAQTAVCNRHHSIGQQLCRWLLLSLDRIPGNDLTMTQELIANMLGVRREGVTEAAVKLQKAGIIHYKRGHISIIDRSRLETQSCECYKVVKNETERLR